MCALRAGMHPQKTTQHYTSLDGMRGIASIMVMLDHYSILHLAHPLLKNAYIAVDIFFLLSGFVILHAYGAKLKTGMRFSEFMSRRLIRLYPMYLLGLVLGVPVLYGFMQAGFTDYSVHDIGVSFLQNLFFLPYFNAGHVLNGKGAIHGALFPANGPAWSMFFEMLASIFFIFLIKFSRGTLLAAAVFGFALVILTGLLHYTWHPGESISVAAGWSAFNFIGGFPRTAYAFTCGITLYLFLDRLRATSWGRHVDSNTTAPLFIYTGLMAMFAFPYAIGGFYYLLAIGILAPLLLAGGALASCGPRLTSASKRLGKLSYPVYCLHYPVGRAAYLISTHYGMGGTYAFITACIITLCLATAALKFYDEPLRRFLARRQQHAIQTS